MQDFMPPLPHFWEDSGSRPCVNHLTGENGGGSPPSHFDAVLSDLENARHVWVYLAEIPRIYRQIFSARAFGARGIPS